MKKISTYLLSAAAMLLGSQAWAANTVETVESVSSAIKLTTDVDYIITSNTPFETGGSVDIVNTDHAVLIFYAVLPSGVTDDGILANVKINGEAAKKNVNCQVKMYNQGSIVLPYEADCNPLTVYSEANFQGTSTSALPIETFNANRVSENAYMATLTDDQLNNQISSFKLKRGYMVTFAVGNEGWGYSRCFIAADEDLEIAELPIELDNRISSYRIFIWNDCQKKGLAADSAADLKLTNSSSTYTWSGGSYISEDYENVPHVIKLGWPGDCGTILTSCYLKTNNEPGNSADDGGYEPVDDVLDTWEDMMRTGKRLLSPSSHDGSLSWMQAFMDSIDARGWRCDIVDMHCYWPEWNLNYGLESYYNKYKRPIWISEFVYGASWNSNGIFGYAKDKYGTTNTDADDVQAENLRVMSTVFNNWNKYEYVERYFYWNWEAVCSKIIYNGNLTQLGEFYRDMDTGLAYNKDYDFVPVAVARAPKDLRVAYDEDTYQIIVSWVNKNRDLTNEMYLEMLNDNDEWQIVASYSQAELDANSDFTYTIQLDDDFLPTAYLFRVRTKEFDGAEHMTKSVPIDVYRDVEGYSRITFINGSETVRIQMVETGSTVSAPGEGYNVDGILMWCTDTYGFEQYDFSEPVTKDLVLYAIEEVNVMYGWDANGSTSTTPQQAGWICNLSTMNWNTVITGTTSIAAYRDNLDGIERAFIRPGNKNAIFAYPVQLYAGHDYTLTLGNAGMNGVPTMNYGINTESDNSGTMIANGSTEAPQWSDASGRFEMSFTVEEDGLYYFTWQSDFTDRNFIWDLFLAGGTRPVTVTFVTNGAAEIDPIQVMAGARIEEPEVEREGYLFGGWFTDEACTIGFNFNDAIPSDLTIYALWTKNMLNGWDGLGQEITPEEAGWTTTDSSIEWNTPINSADYDYAYFRDNLDGMGRVINHPQSDGYFAYPTLELQEGETYILSLTASGFNKSGNQTFMISTEPDGTGDNLISVTKSTPVWGSTVDIAYKLDCDETGTYYFVWHSDVAERSFIGKLMLDNEKDTSITADYPAGIEAISGPAASQSIVNVYTVMGVCVKSNVKVENALDGLAPGFYIVGGQKVIK